MSWICLAAGCGSNDDPELPPRSIAERLADLTEVSERSEVARYEDPGRYLSALCSLLEDAREQHAPEAAEIQSRVRSSFDESRQDMRRLTAESEAHPFVRKLLEDLYAAGESDPCNRRQVIISGKMEASTTGPHWDARAAGDSTSFAEAFNFAAKRSALQGAGEMASQLRGVAGSWVEVKAESYVPKQSPSLLVKHTIDDESTKPVEFGGTQLPWLTLDTEIELTNPLASSGRTSETVRLPRLRVRLGASIKYEVRRGNGTDRSNEMSAVVDYMVGDLGEQHREAARDALGFSIPDPRLKPFAGAYDLKISKVVRNDCGLEPAATPIVIDARRRAVLNPDGSAFPAKAGDGGSLVATFESAQEDCPGKQATSRIVITRGPDGTLASTETVSLFDAPSCTKACELVEEVAYVPAGARPAGTRPAAAAAAASTGPSFADPDSARQLEALQQALEQLEARGPKHARYPDDCTNVWTAVESGSLPGEKDPAAVALVERLARFCVHDLALKLADRRLEVIAVTEQVLEKKVTRFDPAGWDRICGLPIRTLAKAAKRYPAEAGRFKRLAAPILKRCGRGPAGTSG